MKKLVASLIGAGLIVISGAALAGPLVDKSVAYDRELRAEAQQHASLRCVPANGAQIMGGFAASGDVLDAVTGQPCAHR